MTTWKITEYKTLTQCNPLFDAIREKDLDKFKKEMVVQDINYQTPEGWTALMVLSRIGRSNVEMEMIELLLQGGAEPNIQSNYGSTALLIASCYSRTYSTERTVEILLQAGADPNLRNNYGLSALSFASYYSGTTSTERTVELLLQAGADPNTNASTKKIYQRIMIRKARNTMAVKMSIGFHLPDEFYDQFHHMIGC